MSERDNFFKKIYDIFDENSPRPPVPGEERPPTNCPSQIESSRRSSSSSPQKFHPLDAYVGFESEMTYKSRPSSRQDLQSRPICDNPSPPACLKWAQSLYILLDDPDGVELFRRYLQSEGKPHADALDFWFACEGLRKQTEPERVQQFAKVIYKRFFLKSALPISDDLRKEVGRMYKSSPSLEPPVALFDEAQVQVETLINNTTYPNFLKSDMYVQMIFQSAQNPPISSGEFSSESSSSSSTRELSNLASGVGPLPTLHEDIEFMPSSSIAPSHTPGTGCISVGYHTPYKTRLTKDTLLATQDHRALDVRPKHEAFGVFMYRGMGIHAAYNSYNPVSRQDSELQSLSSHSHSDARTESDNLSLTDSSMDGKAVYRSTRRHSVLQTRQLREQAATNKETNMHQTLIPRTQRLDTRQIQHMDPKEYASKFAPILIEKLEKIRREQESQELLDKKLMMEGECIPQDEKIRLGNIQSREFAIAIREKLQVEDDNDQDILDQHVSRVFSDLTPARSPGVTSPRPHSPRRWTQEQFRPRRKDKDGFSTFSSDSGNVHDFAEGSEHKIALIKSKSIPEYGDERCARGTSRRSSSKKTLTDLTDSGVSVVSDTPPAVHATGKDSRVLAWVMDAERIGRGTGHTHSEMSAKHGRHRKASRSNSLERSSMTGALGPAQPFVADPNMPPLPSPNTAIQLEEARRRLEDDMKNRSRQRPSNKYFPEVSQSGQSTLRKSSRAPKTVAATPEDVTTVVFSFCDEQFPYRTKIPGRQITLRQFKEYLPKKGNYRYFFKTECEELGHQVINEEVSNDADVVPLWEGKIMAQVKPID